MLAHSTVLKIILIFQFQEIINTENYKNWLSYTWFQVNGYLDDFIYVSNSSRVLEFEVHFRRSKSIKVKLYINSKIEMNTEIYLMGFWDSSSSSSSLAFWGSSWYGVLLIFSCLKSISEISKGLIWISCILFFEQFITLSFLCLFKILVDRKITI